jgi:hypothetical protein
MKTKKKVIKSKKYKGGATFTQIGVACIFRSIYINPPHDESDFRHKLYTMMPGNTDIYFNKIIHSSDIKNKNEFKDLTNKHDFKIAINNYNACLKYFENHPDLLQPYTIGRAAVLRDTLVNNPDLTTLFDNNHKLNLFLNESTYRILTLYMVHAYEMKYDYFINKDNEADEYLNQVEKVLGIERLKQILDNDNLVNIDKIHKFDTYTPEELRNAKASDLLYGDGELAENILQSHNRVLNPGYIKPASLSSSSTRESSPASTSASVSASAKKSKKPKQKTQKKTKKTPSRHKKPSAQELSAQELSAQELSAQELSAQELSAQELSAQEPSAQDKPPSPEGSPPNYIPSENTLNIVYKCKVDILKKNNKKVKVNVDSISNLKLVLHRNNPTNNINEFISFPFHNIVVLYEEFFYSNSYLYANVIYKLPDKAMFDANEFIKLSSALSKTPKNSDEYLDNLNNMLSYVVSSNFDEYIREPKNLRMIDIILNKCNAEKDSELSYVNKCIKTLEKLKETGNSSRHVLLPEDIQDIIEDSFNQIKTRLLVKVNGQENYYIKILDEPEEVKFRFI